MKKLFCALFALVLALSAVADEGMWPIMSLHKDVAAQLRAAGLKLKDGDLYNPNGTAISDAVVAINGGMGSGSMISADGLMITNHHVAYADICALSSPEHNYLDDGFWAQDQAHEIPIPGTSVTFLRKVIDITAEAQQLIAERKASGHWGMMSMRKVFGDLEERYAKNPEGYEPSCIWFWRGEKFYIVMNEVFRDVRLAACPPARIGAFGGDTDNWGWPQHKGDFTIYRVYAKNGRPAEYSADNTPLKPRKFLKISTSGVHEGDYAMVLGYPDDTNRYMSSGAIEHKQEVVNPVVVERRHSRMEIMRRHMDADKAVRLNYSDAFFNLANYADFAKWEVICLKRDGVVGLREQEEQKMQAWIQADPQRKATYGDLIARLRKGYQAVADVERTRTYYREAWFSPSNILIVGTRMGASVRMLRKDKIDSITAATPEIQKFLKLNTTFLETKDPATERELFADALQSFTAHVDRQYWGEGLEKIYDQFGGDANRIAAYVAEKSYCASLKNLQEFFAKPHSLEELEQDPVYIMARSVKYMEIAQAVRDTEKKAGCDISDDEKLYQQALHEYRLSQNENVYPDANSSMRLTYGHVKALAPRDGIRYEARSTVQGYLEKADSLNHDFNVDAKMRNLIRTADFGRWGEQGKLYVDFITDNDIIGGNSGSPVLNAKGDLIGLAFDGNRESMSCNLYFRPDMNRCVCVDIRYVMWVIEKYAGREDLLSQFQFVK